MRVYFYTKTDHRGDLDRLRRLVALAKEFEDVYFMTTDFRAASYVKQMGIKKSVGIEDVGNIFNVCERGDILIFDSDEYLEENLHLSLIDFFSLFIRVSYEQKDMPTDGEILISPYVVGANIINAVLIDREYFHNSFNKDINRCYFWGDADYEKELLKIAPKLKEFNLDFLEGFYFFVGFADELAKYFNRVYEIEEYEEVLKRSKIFISSSPQSALEAAAAGAKVIFFPKGESEYTPLLQRAGIVNMGVNIEMLQEALLKAKGCNREFLETLNVSKAAKEIKKVIKEKYK
jgi:hypothetical protein